ncbi:MAG: hypothetical protein NZO58_04825 [Gemmataceae bacterium]|nr:hypothetical protein [Gemmataceae bacterium]
MGARRWLMLGVLVFCASGCVDSMPVALRDWYNVQHEFLDTMTWVVDEDSAARYNATIKDRVRPKENAIKERRDKIVNATYGADDKKKLVAQILELKTKTLKAEIDSLDVRLRQQQHRIRKILVKLAWDKAEEMKRSTDREFEVNAAEIWKELSNLELPAEFAAPEGGGGGLTPPGGGMVGMPGMPTMPGPGGPQGGGPQGGGDASTPKSEVDPNANVNLSLFIVCRPRGGGQWEPNQVIWKSGRTIVPTPLRVPKDNGIDITPTTYQ